MLGVKFLNIDKQLVRVITRCHLLEEEIKIFSNVSLGRELDFIQYELGFLQHRQSLYSPIP